MRVPLVYKPGILRDGTKFQSDFCTDGQWIRFVGGKIKKMRGQRAIALNDPNDRPLMLHFEGNKLFYATLNKIKSSTINNGLTLNNHQTLRNTVMPRGGRWQAVKFFNDNVPSIAFLLTRDAADITNVSAAQLWTKPLNDNNVLVQTNINAHANEICGGILYSHPCLYLYGNNGILIRSRTNNPLEFTQGNNAGEDGQMYRISTDKLLFGANVRGGTNAPSFLFWTSNSVIYLTNVADINNVQNPVDFQVEVVTSNSSLISTRAVVQYDSLFFWLGTDRIFVYNGIVDSVPNSINLEYFFDNVDMNRRQEIYGYKVPKYGEIRWAYPEINVQSPYCTRELVYNVRENTWYDTAIRRSCVTTRNDTGEIFSFGDSCANYPFHPDNQHHSLWKHETEHEESRNGRFLPIPSFFTTPFYGFVTFSPAKDNNAVDKYIILEEIEPDFPTTDLERLERVEEPENEPALLNIKVVSRLHPMSPLRTEIEIEQNINQPRKIDIRKQGRFLQITFSSDQPYEVGNVLLKFNIGDGK